jgi:hypothetical protein
MPWELHRGLVVKTDMAKRVLSVLSLVLASGGLAQSTATQPPHETRQHYEIKSPSGIDDYTITRIIRDSEVRDGVQVLIRNALGTRFIVTRTGDYEHQRSTYEIRDLETKDVLRVQYSKPFTSKTRTATIEEAHKSPALMDADQPFEISTTSDATVTGLYSHWRDPETARRWRSQIRQMLTPDFIEQLEIMQSSALFDAPLLEAIDKLLMQYVLYRTDCQVPSQLHVQLIVPDCKFDAAFGYACSDKQTERASNAAEKKLATTY